MYLLPENIDGEDAMAALSSPDALRNKIRILTVQLYNCTLRCKTVQRTVQSHNSVMRLITCTSQET